MLFKSAIVAAIIVLSSLTVSAQEDVFSLSCLGTETSVKNSGEQTIKESVRKTFIIRGSDKMIAEDVSRRQALEGYSPSGLCPAEDVNSFRLESGIIQMFCLGATISRGARRDSFSFYRETKKLYYTIKVFRAPEFGTPASETTYVASCNEREL